MVSHKCVEEFGYKGYQLPANARAPRSARKKRSFEKKKIRRVDKNSAIDLLATVAENLLFESESSLLPIDKPVNEDIPVEEKLLKPVTLSKDNHYQGSLSPCGFNSVINGKDENKIDGFSNSGGCDSCLVRNSNQNLKPGLDGDVVVLGSRPNVVVTLGSGSSRTEVPSTGNGASVNLFSRDDDENFCGYIYPRVTKKSARTMSRIGDRRIRKILASRHWKGASSHADAKPRKNYYLHHHWSYSIKKRRYFDRISDSISDDYRLRSKMQRGSRTFVSSDSHVRLRIKSFKVSELFVEIPETATVGSLKRMVMEAVSTLLSDGHRVGLMVQGKKVRDDNKTLQQTGISQDNTYLDSLDFSLEPSSQTPKLLTSYPLGHACEELLPVGHHDTNMDNVLKSDLGSALFPSDPGKKTATDDSKVLVPVVSCGKSKRSEQQRRIRRPYSVGEVEALVQAVEKLGNGRWRDVKLYAFENADHRTYVDLKDKWKTLVHTAKISPQQRRGEQVPEELLNRVLNARDYWSHQQNMNNKPQEETLLLLNDDDIDSEI